jgi:hypothetical protein
MEAVFQPEILWIFPMISSVFLQDPLAEIFVLGGYGTLDWFNSVSSVHILRD